MTHLGLAPDYINDMDHKKLKIDKKIFSREMFRQEIYSGIYFLNRRPRRERISITLPLL